MYDTILLMGRKTQFLEGGFYHIYNRGNNKNDIFFNDKDRERFIKLLFLCNRPEPVVIERTPQYHIFNKSEKDDQTLVDIGAYCLMPNHFHLLLHEHTEGGISKFMQKLSTAYSMYVNIRYERTGGLFGGRYKSQHANNDNYLKYLFAYIHLNPVKIFDSKWKENSIENRKGAQEYLKNYRFSSYLDYAGEKRKEDLILNKSPFPQYFDNFGEFNDFITEWLTYDEEK